MDVLEKIMTEEMYRREIEAANDVKKLLEGANMSKKLTLIWEDDEGGMVYAVDAEGMARFAKDAEMNMENDDEYVKEYGLPKIKLEMWTPEQWAEANRIGKEMA